MSQRRLPYTTIVITGLREIGPPPPLLHPVRVIVPVLVVILHPLGAAVCLFVVASCCGGSESPGPVEEPFHDNIHISRS